MRARATEVHPCVLSLFARRCSRVFSRWHSILSAAAWRRRIRGRAGICLADWPARRRQPDLRRCTRVAVGCGCSALRGVRDARHVLSHCQQHRHPCRGLATRRRGRTRAWQPHDHTSVQRQFSMGAGARARGAHARTYPRRAGERQPDDCGGDRRHAGHIRLPVRPEVRWSRRRRDQLRADGERAVSRRARLARRSGERPRVRRSRSDLRLLHGRYGLQPAPSCR